MAQNSKRQKICVGEFALRATTLGPGQFLQVLTRSCEPPDGDRSLQPVRIYTNSIEITLKGLSNHEISEKI